MGLIFSISVSASGMGDAARFVFTRLTFRASIDWTLLPTTSRSEISDSSSSLAPKIASSCSLSGCITLLTCDSSSPREPDIFENKFGADDVLSYFDSAFLEIVPEGVHSGEVAAFSSAGDLDDFQTR